MACVYTFGGNTLDCKDSIGGIKEIYIADYSWISGVSINVTTDIVTGITLTSTNKFKTYKLNKQVSSLTITPNTNDTAGTTWYQSDVLVVLPKMNAAKRLEFQAMTVGNMAVIVRDQNNTYWYLGKANPVTATAGSAGTGTAFGDANQFSITISDMGKNPPYEVSSTIMVGITDANIQLPVA